MNDMVATEDRVELGLEIEGLGDAILGVRSIELDEALNALPLAKVDALCHGADPDVPSLLDSECTIWLQRGVDRRTFRGLIRRALVHEEVEGLQIKLEVVPALGLLGGQRDSRIFQDKTVLEVVEAIVQEQLGPRRRTLRNECEKSYEKHELLVQYEESSLAFLGRLLEREGIIFFFDHEPEQEVLVLRDSVSGCPLLHPDEGGTVPFASISGEWPAAETICGAEHAEQIGPTGVVIKGYDWTNPSLEVKSEQEPADGQPGLIQYEHAAALSFHRYGDGHYQMNSAAAQAQIRAELLEQQRHLFHMEGSVLMAQPGHRMELSGAPDLGIDGGYLIVSNKARAAATAGAPGTFHQRLECAPSDRPYRPARVTPRPLVHGLQSATVVGPPGEEIHTDQHGRIKAYFHWDRHGRPDEESTCWLRVMQLWSGPGWGAMALPRIGMEVIVSFVDGNPEHPVVLGCLYNGENRPPYPLPDEKTKSTLKSNSSPGGGGSNEFRFEDKAGKEEVYLHAQKDFHELVEHDHGTHVRHDQSNVVDNDQREIIHGNQDKSVDGNRTVYIRQNVEETIDNDYTRQILGKAQDSIVMGETRTIQNGLTEMIQGGETRRVEDGQRETIIGDKQEYIEGNSTQTIAGEVVQQVRDGIGMFTPGEMKLEGKAGIRLQTDGPATLIAHGGWTTVAPAGQRHVDSVWEWTGGTKNEACGSAFEMVGAKMESVLVEMKAVGLAMESVGAAVETALVAFESSILRLEMPSIHLSDSEFALHNGALMLVGESAPNNEAASFSNI